MWRHGRRRCVGVRPEVIKSVAELAESSATKLDEGDQVSLFRGLELIHQGGRGLELLLQHFDANSQPFQFLLP